MREFGAMDKEKILALAVNLNPIDKGDYAECVCPKCGQMRAFFYYSAGLFSWITCNRRNDCGFTGRLWDHCERPGEIKSECLLGDERTYFEQHGIDFDCLVASGFIGTLGQLYLAIDQTGKEWRKELRPDKGKLRWMLPKGWKVEMGEWYPLAHEGKRLYVLEGDADRFKGIQDGLPCTASLFGGRGKVSTEKGKAVFVGHEEIVIVPHQDTTGLQKSKELALFLKQMFPCVKVSLCHLPFTEEEKKAGGKDYCDYRVKHSLEEFQRLPLVEIESPKAVEQGPCRIVEKDGKTFILNEVKDKEEGVKLVPSMIADFLARIIEEIVDDDGNVSQVFEIERNGKKRRVEIKPGEVVELSQFRRAVGSKGLSCYDAATVKSHNAFMAFVEGKSTPKELKKTQYLGRIEPGIFLFGDGIATPNGVEGLGAFIPSKTSMVTPKKVIDLKGLVEDIEKIIPGQGWKFWGFAVATLFVDEIARRRDGFPILFLRGQSQTGKNTIAGIIQSLFSVHLEKNISFNLGAKSTNASVNRTASKYRCCPIVINEYMPNERINLSLISYYDRSGYNRAYTNNTLDTFSSEINATFLLLSTWNIGGTKSEDLLSRVVAIDMAKRTEQTAIVSCLDSGLDTFSHFVAHCLSKIDPVELLTRIKETEWNNRACCTEQRVEQRIFRNHSMLAAAANVFYESVGLGESGYLVGWNEIKGDVIESEETQHGQDIGQIFLEALESMVKSKGIDASLAKIESSGYHDEEETLYFASLKVVLPQVKRFGRMADIPVCDEKTLAAALKRLGVNRTFLRKFDSHTSNTWVYKIPKEQR